jgi:hypothetical protein
MDFFELVSDENHQVPLMLPDYANLHFAFAVILYYLRGRKIPLQNNAGPPHKLSRRIAPPPAIRCIHWLVDIQVARTCPGSR